MSYQISVIHRAKTFSICKSQFLPSSLGHQRKDAKVSFYRVHSITKEKVADSVNRAHSVIEEKIADSVNRAHSVIEEKVADSVNRVHSVIKGKLVKSVFTELTRSSQGTQCLPSSLGD